MIIFANVINTEYKDIKRDFVNTLPIVNPSSLVYLIR